MTIREQILSDIKDVNNLKLLYQILAFIQILKRNVIEPKGKRDGVLQFAGTLSNEEAKELQKNISDEFSNVEGQDSDWQQILMQIKIIRKLRNL